MVLRRQLRDGYWCCQGEGVERGSAEVMPLDLELYLQEAADFVSENDETPRVLLSQGPRFVFRQRGDRHLISGRQRESVREWANGCRRRYREVVVKEMSSAEKGYELQFGARNVRWPGRQSLHPSSWTGWVRTR